METWQKYYANKRVLITGGTGFIGSHIAEKLVALGARVTVLDNFSTGNVNNLKTILPLISLSYADIRSAYSCLKATVGIDMVFHTASFVSVPESINNPKLCYDTNIQGTENILEGCKKNGVQSFIFSSSSAVYGNKNEECREDDELNPQSPYATSKRDAEILCQEYAKNENMHIAVLRYFNVYGTRQNPEGPYAAVVARFTQQLKSGQPITIFGDGMQTRDFVHVSKVVEANLMLAMREEIKGDIFNVGSGKSITIFQLIENLEKELNIKASGISFFPARQGDIINSHANCEKYFKTIGQNIQFARAI